MVPTIWIISNIVMAMTSTGHSADPHFFDGKDYQGSIPYFTGNEQGAWIQFPSGCFNVPELGRKKISSIRTNNNCIVLFGKSYCQGESIKITQDVSNIADLEGHATHDNFNDETMSIRYCNTENSVGWPEKINLALYSETGYTGTKQEYSNLCKCTTLPKTGNNQPKSVDNYHNCITFFTSETCNMDGGDTLDVFAGKSSVSQNLTSQRIYGNIAAFRPCETPQACFKLAADVYQITVVDENDETAIAQTSNFLSMSAKTVMINNGSAQITQEYFARKEVKESMEVQTATLNRRIESWSGLHSKTTTHGIKIIIPMKYATLTIGVEISNSLQTAYSKTTEDVEYTSTTHLLEASTEFGVRQLIEVPPCSVYAVDSFVKVVEGYPLYYQMHFTLRGEHANKRMRADELRILVNSMPPYKYNHTIDEFTIGVYTTAAITASFGVETEILGTGSRIPGCY